MSDSNTRSSTTVVWEWTQVVLLSANLTWTSLCLGGYRPETMVLTSALYAALLAVHLGGAAWQRWRGEGRASHPAGWLLLPFLVYAAANVVRVSPVPWLGWLDWLGWAQLVLVFWVVLNGVRSRPARATLLLVLLLLAVTGVVLGAYQKFANPEWLMMGRLQALQFVGRASGFFGIPNSLAALLLLVLPATIAFAVRRKATAVQRVLGGYLAAVLAFGLIMTVSRGAWLALTVAMVGWPVFVMSGSWIRRLVWGAAIGGGGMAVVATLYFAVPLVQQRLATMHRDRGEVTRPIMWRGAWQIFTAHPIWGGGAGAYNVLFEAHRPEAYQDEPTWAHNEYLNTLCDYGAVGVGLSGGAAVVILGGCVWARRRVLHKPRSDERQKTFGRRRSSSGWVAWCDEPLVNSGLVVGLAAFTLQMIVDFNFKLPALAMLFATSAALLVQRYWLVEAAPSHRSRLAAIGSIAAGVGVVLATWSFVVPRYRGEALRYGARQAIDGLAVKDFDLERWRSTLASARAALQNAVVLAPSNGAAWADLAYVTVLTGHVTPERTSALADEAMRAAEKALAISRVVPEFWVRKAVPLDLQQRHYDAGRAFAEALRLAPNRASIWYNYAFHLSLQPGKTALARGAVEFCLRLDPSLREAQALRQRLAASRRAP